ncbi:MAG TPA: hypothetical protein VNV66_01285, partial [Pilimelia sp.]|nr:hypothetical protein [Pilimelia sp.]
PADRPTTEQPVADRPSVAPTEAGPTAGPARTLSTPPGEPTPTPGSIVPGVDPLDVVEEPLTDPTEGDGLLGQLGRTFGGLLG